MPCSAISLPLLSQLITAAGGQAALGGNRQGLWRQTLWQQQAPSLHPSLSPASLILLLLFSVSFHMRTVPVNYKVRMKTISQHGEQKKKRWPSRRQSVLEQLIHNRRSCAHGQLHTHRHIISLLSTNKTQFFCKNIAMQGKVFLDCNVFKPTGLNTRGNCISFERGITVV